MDSFIKKYGFLVTLLAFCIITIIAYSWFVDTVYFDSLYSWARENILLFCLLLFLIKVIAIVWPPLPGIIFSIAAIPIIGWELACFINLLGETVGASSAFGLSRKFGPKVVKKLFGESGLDYVRKFNFKPNKEFEAIFILRAFTAAVSELVSYGSGLTKIKFRNFFFATLTSSFLVGLPLFYFAGLVLGGENILLGLIPLCIGFYIMYSLRKRYFIWEN